MASCQNLLLHLLISNIYYVDGCQKYTWWQMHDSESNCEATAATCVVRSISTENNNQPQLNQKVIQNVPRIDLHEMHYSVLDQTTAHA